MNHSIQNPSIVSDMIDSQRLQTLYMVNNMLKQIEADGLNIYVILPRVVNLAVKQLNAQEGSILVVNEDLIAVEYAWSTKNSIDNTASDEFLGTIMSGGVPGSGGTIDVGSGDTSYRITVAPFTGKLTVDEL